MLKTNIIEELSSSGIWVGENKVTLIEKNIVNVVAVGFQSDATAFALNDINYKLLASTTEVLHFLIDLNLAGKNSQGARKQWTKISEESRTGKIALFGLHPVARVLASFVIGVSRNKEMRFFNTRNDALKWLME